MFFKRGVIVCAVVAAFASSAFAQEAGKIRWGLDFLYGMPGDDGWGAGISTSLGYNITDNMNAGIKVGIVGMAKADPRGIDDAEASLNTNYLGTFTYYHHLGASFAPFAGVGVGLYDVTTASLAGINVDDGMKFGGMLTAGFEFGKCRLAMEYNMVPSSKVEALTIGGYTIGLKDKEISNSYFAITLGFFVGGGKR